MEVGMEKKHFVLVHGAGHGAWCWYKLKPLLEHAGHKVTALDLAASGINLKTIYDLHTLYDYTVPLLEFMASIPPDEKVILVGHSLGGLNLALTMDTFPEKILMGVFVSAFMPDTTHAPSYVIDKHEEQYPREMYLDTKFWTYGNPEQPGTAFQLGPKFLASRLYQLSPIEDLELAYSLVRPSSLFQEALRKAKRFSNEGYGSVKRGYIVFREDKAIPEDFQRWQIENFGVTVVKEIGDADHMAMLSRPQQLCQRLLEIADEFN